MPDYRPQALDKKWQDRWTRARAFEVTEDPSRPKFYCLEMFAYPSGHAHVGHVRNYLLGDVVALVEGGYDLKALADCTRAVGQTLGGEAPEVPPPAGDDARGGTTCAAVVPGLREYWRL